MLEEWSAQGPQMDEFVQSLQQQVGGSLLQAVDHIADLASCLEGMVAMLEGRVLLEKKRDDLTEGEQGCRPYRRSLTDAAPVLQ